MHGIGIVVLAVLRRSVLRDSNILVPLAYFGMRPISQDTHNCHNAAR